MRSNVTKMLTTMLDIDPWQNKKLYEAPEEVDHRRLHQSSFP